jgi:DNA-binding transcriptional ArsR family regulator
MRFIDYRRLSMKRPLDTVLLDRGQAETYASWFKALADPTRVQILHLLASRRVPMTVGAIVEQVAVGQSTVSHHLKILAEARFVLVEPAGTANLFRVNEACIECFPSAADIVMGRPAPTTVPNGDQCS